jgi:hypothetical protein
MKVTITFEADVKDLDIAAMQPIVDAILDGEEAKKVEYEEETTEFFVVEEDEAEPEAEVDEQTDN